MPLSDHYQLTGSGSPIVFVHGSYATTSTWKKMIEQLSARHTCIAIKLPGHCGTPDPQDFDAPTIETELKLIEDVVRSLTDEPIHLVGHSRKGKDESIAPGKMDVKGSGAITDQVDNVIVWWRKKAKEAAVQAGESYDAHTPDALMVSDKQRNGECEGKVGLFFDKDSMQYLENGHQPPADMLSSGYWA